ncbi:MAG: cation transporter [Oscillospiraceae bacterium]|nr:cation transporter [Oscillospiraceae bacterium]
MKKTYAIEVDCPNCAAKIETAVNKLEGVEKATVSYLTQKLILETGGDPEALLPAIRKAAKKIEPDFVLKA